MHCKHSDSFCRSPSDLLLTAVENNDHAGIQSAIDSDLTLIKKTYPGFKTTILQIALCNFGAKVSPETVELLIRNGADLEFCNKSNDHFKTIHYAALTHNPPVLKLILDSIDAKSINDVTSGWETALVLLVRYGDVNNSKFAQCLNLLLQYNVDVNKADKKGNTPIVVAVKKRYRNVIKLLLESGKYVDIDNFTYSDKSVRQAIVDFALYDAELPPSQSNLANINNNVEQDFVSLIMKSDENGFLNHPNLGSLNVNDESLNATYLQMACARNLKLVVKHLLSKGALVDQTSKTNAKIPLEIATAEGTFEIFELLLRYHDTIPEGILITLLENSIYKADAISDHKRCLNWLLNQNRIDVHVNSSDSNGNTPLHYAVKYSDQQTVLKLLAKGASLWNRNDDGVLPVEDIYAKTLEKHLDDCIRTEISPPCNKQGTVVIFDYRSLLPCDTTPKNCDAIYIEPNCPSNSTATETDVVMAMSQNPELRSLLKHPVISNLLFLKFYKMQLFFNTNFIFYAIFVLSLLVHVFAPNQFFYLLLLVTYFLLVLREFAELFSAPKTYGKDLENYLELGILISTGLVIFSDDKNYLFFKQSSAVAILLSSIELMLLLGQYPIFSTYISVLKTVSFNFLRFMVWSALLIVAFTLCFYILYHDDQPINNDSNNETDFFQDPTLTFVKVVVMLTGEFDAGSLDLESPLNRIILLVFVFLITITLFNVLNGLAVSDIQSIKEDAEIVSLVERINRIVYVERMLVGDGAFSKLIRVVARCFCCLTNTSKSRSLPNWAARKAFLFPFSFNGQEVEMWLFDNGRIRNKINGKNCKPCRSMFVHSSVVKYTKEIILKRQNQCDGDLKNRVDKLKKDLGDKQWAECQNLRSELLIVLNSMEAFL